VKEINGEETLDTCDDSDDRMLEDDRMMMVQWR